MKNVFGLLLLLAVGTLSLAANAEMAPKVGFEPPAFVLPNLDGKNFSLADCEKGQPIILFFFASWSKTCQEEFNTIKNLAENKDKPVKVIAISLDKKPKDLATFLDKNKPTFPVLLDKKLTLIDRYHILIIPTTFCINKERIIEKIFVDYDENVKQALLGWL